jgi:serine protease Do
MGSGYESKKTVSLWQCILIGLIIALVVGVVTGCIVANSYDKNQVASSNENQSSSVNEISVSEGNSVAVSEKVSPSVVFISNIVDSRNLYNSYFGFGGYGNSSNGYGDSEDSDEEDVVYSTGSGVIYSEDGYIITNNHVVEGADKVRVQLYDGTEYDATVIGTDEQSDLAVIKIEATGLTAAEFGDSDDLVVGEMAVAIGNPGGADFVNSVTQGIISGLNRNVEVSEGQFMTLVQTDAAINPGNSGGALCNGEGQVIGINTIKISSNDFEGMGFAIPSNTVIDICTQLMENGKVSRPALQVGIYTDITAQMASYYGLDVDYGILVKPAEGGAAAKAGLENYDIIIAIDGNKVETTSELQKYLYEKNIGDTVTVTVNRDGQNLDFDVVLGELE